MKKLSVFILVLAMAFPICASGESVRGDMNGDGDVNVADVTALIHFVLSHEWPGGVVLEHDFVDLGLPSGTLWATTNVGATNPEDYGDYFAWAETTPKDNYGWGTTAYAYYEGSSLRFSKYNTNATYGDIDNLTELEPEDDAAYVNWGSEWRMPTSAQFDELRNTSLCTWTWTTLNGVNGHLIKGPNGNTIFLPAAGQRSGTNTSSVGTYGNYWSRGLHTNPMNAYKLYFSKTSKQTMNGSRNYGYPVRPVYVSEEMPLDENRGDLNGDGNVNIADVTALIHFVLSHEWPGVEPIEEYVDLGLPSGTLWATYNVGASRPEETGDYFAWGETTPNKENYVWDNTQWLYSENGQKRISKYNTNSQYGEVDNLTELEPEDDAAYVNRGPEWRMPSKEQIDELVENCTWEWTELNGVNGQLVTGPNGNTMFLPAAGLRIETDLSFYGTNGNYWTRSLDVVSETISFPLSAYKLYVQSEGISLNAADRSCGHPVRAVRVPLD